MIPRLKEQYDKIIVGNLQKKLAMSNKLMVPKIVKVVLNMGLGADANDKKKLQNCIEDMSLISGQKPVVTSFKKSISNFKLKEGSPIGVSVILRREKMYEFFDRLVNVALPRVRDFRGVSEKGFDGMGNYTLGIKEQLIFPEIHYDMVEKIFGMNVTIVTDAKSNEEGKSFLKLMGMPFRSLKEDG